MMALFWLKHVATCQKNENIYIVMDGLYTVYALCTL